MSTLTPVPKMGNVKRSMASSFLAAKHEKSHPYNLVSPMRTWAGGNVHCDPQIPFG